MFTTGRTCKLMTSSRRVSAVVPLKSLRAQYPPAMYNPKAGGMAGVCRGLTPPPLVRVWHLADLPAVSAREVHYRDAHGQTWDLVIRVPDHLDPPAYEWGARPAMAGLWPGASLLWPVCERGRLTAVMSPGQQLPPDRVGSLRVLWYSDWLLPRAPGRWPHAVREVQLVIIDGLGGLPARRLVWLITYGPPHRYMGLYETREPHGRRLVRRLQDMLLATLRMAGYQPRVTYQLLGFALRPSR